MRTSLAILFLVTVVSSAFTSRVQARQDYLNQFKAQYPNLEEAATAQKCMICHPEKDNKKVRNDYGTAVGTALGAPKVKNPKQIEEALTKAEAEKSAIEGKTFGDLIKEDKLPNETPSQK